MSILKLVIDKWRGPVEDKIREKGHKLINKTFEKQISEGLQLQHKFSTLKNADMLTSSMSLHQTLPKKYRKRITKYREIIRKLIFDIAFEIQNSKFKELDNEIKDSGLSVYQERRYESVRDAQKELYASYDSIREALNYLTDFNRKVLEKITSSKGKKKTSLLLLNAIVVFETTDAIIDLIEDFQLNGKETLRGINNQVFKELKSQESEDDKLHERASNNEGYIEKGVRRSIRERREIREMVTKKWGDIWKMVAALETNILHARGHVETLKLIRDNAKGQIDVLEVIGITQMVESNMNNFQEISSVTNIELAPLTREDVYGLIGKVETIDRPE